MQYIKKNKVLIALLTTVFLITLTLGLSLDFTKKAFAAEIDYVNQNYSNIPTGFDFQDESVIYKIHCPDVRAELGIGAEEEYDTEDYFTTISFKAAMGCQIYFVNGVACNLEDSYYGDYETSMYSDYYDVLHYDDTNKNIFIKFKNVSQLSYPEDLCIMSGEKVDRAQYIYISNIEEPVTEVTAEDVFFSSDVVAAHGGKGWTDYNIYSLEYTLKLNQKVAHLVSKVDVSFIKGGEKFTLNKTSYINSDGVGENGYNNFTIITLGDICDITERVKLQAVITYGDKTITVESSETDLITLWISMVNNDFADSDYQLYMTESNKEHIRKLVSCYNAGFYAEIKGSQNYFADYDANTDIKLTSLIFKIPLTSFSNARFSWNTSYYQGHVYSVSVSVNSDLILTSNAYSMLANEDGTITVSTNIEYNESVASEIYESVDYFAYNDYLYLRIKDDSPVSTYFPQNAERSFSARATDTSGSNITMLVNTATIIYDDYNKELLEEIETLKAQLAEIQELLESANALSESQKELINSLQSSLDNLRVDYENAQTDLAYMTEQMKVMRDEYQKKIDQLINENQNNESTPSDTDKEIDIEKETGLTVEQIIGICAGVILLMAIITLLIPKRRR